MIFRIMSFFLLFSIYAYPQYYVDNSGGKDTNTGLSTNSPFKTIEKALSMITSNTPVEQRKILLEKDNLFELTAQISIIYDYIKITGGVDSITGSVNGSTILKFNGTYDPIRAINIANRLNIEIRNLIIDLNYNPNFGIYLSNSNNCIISNNQFKNFNHDPIAIIGSSDNIISNNLIDTINGTKSDANSITVENSRISGVLRHSNDNQIFNNLIKNNLKHFAINFINSLTDDSSVYGNGNKAWNNTIENCYSGIMISRQKYFQAYNNVIINSGMGITQGGYGIQFDNTRSNSDTSMKWEANNCKIYNNTIYNSRTAGMLIKYAFGMDIINNLFVENRKYQIRLEEQDVDQNYKPIISFSNNLYNTVGISPKFKINDLPDNDPENNFDNWKSYIEFTAFKSETLEVNSSNFTITSTSKAAGRGYNLWNLQGIYPYDKNGVNRLLVMDGILGLMK